MQIQNDFNAYSNTEYHSTHTHHITECLNGHEEKPKEESGALGGKGSSSIREPSGQGEGERIFFQGNSSGITKPEAGPKKGVGLIRRLWDSMGEEGRSGEKAATAAGEGRIRGDFVGGIAAASSAVRNLLPPYLTEKWEVVRDKVKAKAEAAFQHFNTLPDPGRRFLGKKEEKQRRREGAGRRTGRAKPEILSEAPDTHLMDSYSKRGEYCKLNENLTYRREQRREANRRAFSENTGEGEPPKRLDKRL